MHKGSAAGGTNPSPETRPAQSSVRRKILEGTGNDSMQTVVSSTALGDLRCHTVCKMARTALGALSTNRPAPLASKRARRPVRTATIADRLLALLRFFALSARPVCRRQARVSPRTLTGDGTKPRATVTAIKVRPGATWPTTASEEEEQQRARVDPQAAAAELLLFSLALK